MKLASVVLLVLTGVVCLSVWSPGASGALFASQSSVVFCEHSKGRIHCPPRYIIEVLTASYGRRTRHICPSRWIKTLKCHSRRSLYVVRRLCQRKQQCSLKATNGVFGDPCRGTYKYLQVRYRCKRAPVVAPLRTVVACEHRFLRMSCPLGHKVFVFHANYGRTNRYICPHRSSRNTRCIGRGSTNIVRRRCQNRRSCIVRASNRVFGDPCRGTFKYLRVVYRCVR